MRRRERLEREEIELKKKKLKEKEEIIRLLKEKEAEVERLSREEEMAYAAREAAREAKLNRELTNQMLAEADKLLEETAAFQRARKMETTEVNRCFEFGTHMYFLSQFLMISSALLKKKDAIKILAITFSKIKSFKILLTTMKKLFQILKMKSIQLKLLKKFSSLFQASLKNQKQLHN